MRNGINALLDLFMMLELQGLGTGALKAMSCVHLKTASVYLETAQ